jgi:transcription elongation factor Elf1
MPEEEEIKELMIEDRTYICLVCGYTDGFHVSFKRENGKMKIILICPDCHARFDPEWKINIEV